MSIFNNINGDIKMDNGPKMMFFQFVVKSCMHILLFQYRK